jgi:hypothetical protein
MMRGQISNQGRFSRRLSIFIDPLLNVLHATPQYALAQRLVIT